ncbi:MAG: hypothetical protein ABFS23_03430 [Pseudomonadota bacterium]
MWYYSKNFARDFSMDSVQVEDCIETLCRKGCRAVAKDIRILERGEVLPEARHLTIRETRVVLRELQSVMAIYDAAGTCEVVKKKVVAGA